MIEETMPFGGENLSLKELKKEKMPSPKKNTDGRPESKPLTILNLLIAVIIILVLIIALLATLFVFKSPKTLPTPSPVIIISSPTATSTAIPKSVNQRLDELETNLKKVDIEQTEYSFPLIDFKLEFNKD
jgi:flagellar basal body-associated protein FliL